MVSDAKHSIQRSLDCQHQLKTQTLCTLHTSHQNQIKYQKTHLGSLLRLERTRHVPRGLFIPRAVVLECRHLPPPRRSFLVQLEGEGLDDALPLPHLVLVLLHVLQGQLAALEGLARFCLLFFGGGVGRDIQS